MGFAPVHGCSGGQVRGGVVMGVGGVGGGWSVGV